MQIPAPPSINSARVGPLNFPTLACALRPPLRGGALRPSLAAAPASINFARWGPFQIPHLAAHAGRRSAAVPSGPRLPFARRIVSGALSCRPSHECRARLLARSGCGIAGGRSSLVAVLRRHPPVEGREPASSIWTGVAGSGSERRTWEPSKRLSSVKRMERDAVSYTSRRSFVASLSLCCADVRTATSWCGEHYRRIAPAHAHARIGGARRRVVCSSVLPSGQSASGRQSQVQHNPALAKGPPRHLRAARTPRGAPLRSTAAPRPAGRRTTDVRTAQHGRAHQKWLQTTRRLSWPTTNRSPK